MNLFPTVLAGLYMMSLPAVKFPDKNPMAGKIDVISYNINLVINEQDSSITGLTKINFKPVQKTRSIRLNLVNMAIDSCLLNNHRIRTVYKNGLITIKSPHALLPGTENKISIAYHGRPSDGLFIGKNKYMEFCVFSDNWPDRVRYWLPCVDYPSDKALVAFGITAPARFDVIANGRLINKKPATTGNLTWHYNCQVPIPAYCIAIGVTRFAVTETRTPNGIPIYYYDYPPDSLTAVQGFRRVPDMVAFYDSLIGPYPFSKLAIVESSTIFGGMENSSAIFLPDYGPSYTGLSDNEETVAHEIAHQWFGDDVTESNFSDLWLSEGFASYFSILYFEFRDGKNKKEELLADTRKSYLKRSTHKLPVILKRYNDPMELLTTENYEKCALFLDALRNKIGDENWFDGIRIYYDKFKHKNVSTSDFRIVMETVSGQDLKSFFHQWLNKPGLPD